MVYFILFLVHLRFFYILGVRVRPGGTSATYPDQVDGGAPLDNVLIYACGEQE
jgi:hypothetical protein